VRRQDKAEAAGNGPTWLQVDKPRLGASGGRRRTRVQDLVAQRATTAATRHRHGLMSNGPTGEDGRGSGPASRHLRRARPGIGGRDARRCGPARARMGDDARAMFVIVMVNPCVM
jgi:hypothetical protein